MCTEGEFDTNTGDFLKDILEPWEFDDGDYTFTINGTLGDKSVESSHTVTLIDPCPDALITITKPPSFVDSEYMLGDPGFTLSWNDDLVDLNSIAKWSVLN